MAMPLCLQQVHIGPGPAGYLTIDSLSSPNKSDYSQDHAAYEGFLTTDCPASVWPQESYMRSCPRPMLLDRKHHAKLVELHGALSKAILDIVPRWWSDRDADFPSRMPLEPDEERLLQWLDVQVLQGNLAPYASKPGTWRPDFLIEDDGQGGENFRITEINARFSFNGYMHSIYGQTALTSIGNKVPDLIGASDGSLFFKSLQQLFDRSLPLHLLKGDEPGIDIAMFMHAVKKQLGYVPRLVQPGDLRLVPDPQDATKKLLCCLATTPSHQDWPTFYNETGELVEEIRQVGLELYQREIRNLDHEMLRQISLRCFNDLRTILLVHDKRMLGIIRQEIPRLVSRQVLTRLQGLALEKGISETLMPGSPALQALLARSIANPSIRKEYIFKPIRDGKGRGIIFCDAITDDEWLTTLSGLQNAAVTPSSAVVQRHVVQREYNIVLQRTGALQRFPIVGTYHAMHGKYLGIGIWRASGERICAISTGGSWLCSVMRKEGGSSDSGTASGKRKREEGM